GCSLLNITGEFPLVHYWQRSGQAIQRSKRQRSNDGERKSEVLVDADPSTTVERPLAKEVLGPSSTFLQSTILFLTQPLSHFHLSTNKTERIFIPPPPCDSD